jgi:hypothetical protein
MARGRRITSFTQCRQNCRCGHDPKNGPYFLKRWGSAEGRGEVCVSWQEVAELFHGPRRSRPAQTKSVGALPKTPFGSLHLEFKRCGRPNCRCRGGLLHGPYLYRRWRENGRQKKQYVPMKHLSEVALEMERERTEKPRLEEVRRMLKELRSV